MAVVWVREQWEDQEASATDQAVREYQRSWLVLFDSMLCDAVTAILAVNVLIGDLYIGADGSRDPRGALCIKLQARRPDRDQPFLWKVIARYSNRMDPQLSDQDPLTRIPEYSWSVVRATRPAWKDLTGRAIVNSSGERFDPPVEIDDNRLCLKVKKNLPDYDPNMAMAYTDAVNSDGFLGSPPGYAKCVNMAGERHYENDVLYWACELEVHFRNPAGVGWQPQELDQGFYSLYNLDGSAISGGQKRLILDRFGNPLTAPTLLNGAGLELSKSNTTLGALLTQGGTQVQVANNSGFPTTYPFAIQIDGEIIVVLSQVGQGSPGGLYNVQRGQGGTVAAIHSNGATVQVPPIFLTFEMYPALPFSELPIP